MLGRSIVRMTGRARSFSISQFPYPDNDARASYFKEQTAAIQEWFESPRFRHLQRPWTAERVAALRGTLTESYASDVQARKLFNLLETRFKAGEPVHTLGSIDPVQMTQTVANQEVTYVSGWACSSVLTTTNEVSPDFGDYPYDTVPNQVERLWKAQLMHDKKAWLEWTQNPSKPPLDYLRPIIADADTGHGGTGSVMKLAKLFAERGAAAIHLEDQLHGGKKCGHLSGKVVVPTSQHVSRLLATRLQWDIMGTSNLVIARTDSESSSLLSSSIDPRDHEFILGVTEECLPLMDTLQQAEARGATSAELDALELEWTKEHELLTFSEATERALIKAGLSDRIGTYRAESQNKSNPEARKIAERLLGAPLYFNWDAPRSREGYHPVRAGMDSALKRTLSYAPYADMLWLETKKPDLEQARKFAAEIHAEYPHMWLVYNLSPSFNWLGQGFSETDLKEFVFELAKAGFVLQLVSLAGLHTNANATWRLSEAFKRDGMKAYVDLVQSKEKEAGCDVLTHQKWSGANYYDLVQSSVLAGSSSTSSVGKDSTEHDF